MLYIDADFVLKQQAVSSRVSSRQPLEFQVSLKHPYLGYFDPAASLVMSK